jgi:hypothetical protein
LRGFAADAVFDGVAPAPYLGPMGYRMTIGAAVAAFLPLMVPVAAAPDPGGPGVPLPFFRRGLGDAVPPLPGQPARPGAPSLLGPGGVLDRPAPPGGDAAEAAPPKPDRAPTRAETLDKLLGRLARAQDEAEARAVAAMVERLWMESGSDTADLLMTRAVAAMNGDRRDVAAALLDKIIELAPGWAEAWNKRATLRFLENDDSGSMEDISHVLVLEPRHFGALSGMGFILERHGEDAAALKALRRALAVYPQDGDVRKAVDKLAPTVEGQDL